MANKSKKRVVRQANKKAEPATNPETQDETTGTEAEAQAENQETETPAPAKGKAKAKATPTKGEAKPEKVKNKAAATNYGSRVKEFLATQPEGATAEQIALHLGLMEEGAEGTTRSAALKKARVVARSVTGGATSVRDGKNAIYQLQSEV